MWWPWQCPLIPQASGLPYGSLINKFPHCKAASLPCFAVWVLSPDLVLLWQAAVYNSPGRCLLQLPEQVSPSIQALSSFREWDLFWVLCTYRGWGGFLTFTCLCQLSQGKVLYLFFHAVLWQVTLCFSVLQCEHTVPHCLPLARLPHAMLHCRSGCLNFVFHKMRSRACWRKKSRTAERHWEILLTCSGRIVEICRFVYKLVPEFTK